MAEPMQVPNSPWTCAMFLQWMQNAPHPSPWPAAAAQHLAGCGQCQTKVGTLETALADTAEDSLTCDECEAQLPAYLEVQQSTDPVWDSIQRHLRGCPACLALYEELRQLVQQATRAEQFAALPVPPVPDLAFLVAPPRQPTEPRPTWWWLDEAGRLLIEFSAQLLAAFTPPRLVGIKGAGGDRLLYHLTLADAVADLEVTISVQAVDGDQCEVWVDVNLPSTGGWPHLAGSVVTLWRNAEQLDQQLTDAYGKVVFTGIARADLAALRVSIAPTPR